MTRKPLSQGQEAHPQFVDPLGDLYEKSVASTYGSAFLDSPRPRGFLERLSDRFDPDLRQMEKAVKIAQLKLKERVMVAAEQGTVVSEVTDPWQYVDSAQGIKDPTGYTFGVLRQWGHICEPLAAIQSTRIDQVANFSRPGKRHRGHYSEPGWIIEMADGDMSATAADLANIKTYSAWVHSCGFCDPPVNERPEGWQKGFEPFLRGLVRDRVQLDWVAVRTWPSEVDPGKYPVVAFAAVDAAKIRKRRRLIVSVVSNKIVTDEAPKDRRNTSKEITLVKVNADSNVKVEEYSDAEMFTAFARVRTDEESNGYGYSEAEQAVNAITIWCAARDFNKFRFEKNSLPRGVLSILGNMSESQLSAFRKQWRQMVTGLSKSWNIPIVSGQGGDGAGLNFIPFDLSPKDMEYGQFTFTVALWLHALYGIHPDETGFSDSNPMSQPMSEASPETNIIHSQDRGLRPLLRWVEDLMNHNLLWKMDPAKRYVFRFVGLSDSTELDELEAVQLRLTAGVSTPKMEWADRDVQMPPEVADHPASSLPMPWSEGVMFLQQLQQAAAQPPGGQPGGKPGAGGDAAPGGPPGLDANGDEQAGGGDIERQRQDEMTRQGMMKRYQQAQGKGAGASIGAGGKPASPGSRLAAGGAAGAAKPARAALQKAAGAGRRTQWVSLVGSIPQGSVPQRQSVGTKSGVETQ